MRAPPLHGIIIGAAACCIFLVPETTRSEAFAASDTSRPRPRPPRLEEGKKMTGRRGHVLVAQYEVRRRKDSDGIQRVSQKFYDQTADRYVWVRLS